MLDEALQQSNTRGEVSGDPLLDEFFRERKPPVGISGDPLLDEFFHERKTRGEISRDPLLDEALQESKTRGEVSGDPLLDEFFQERKHHFSGAGNTTLNNGCGEKSGRKVQNETQSDMLFTELLERVNDYKNRSKQNKRKWHEFCAGVPGHSCSVECKAYFCSCGAHDPVQFSSEELKQFLSYVALWNDSAHVSWWSRSIDSQCIPWGNDAGPHTPQGNDTKRSVESNWSDDACSRTPQGRRGSSSSWEHQRAGNDDQRRQENDPQVAIWEYKQNDVWVSYHTESCAHVEAAWRLWEMGSNPQDGGGQIILEIGAYIYEIDFTSMTQTNQKTSKVRPIRRRVEVPNSQAELERQMLVNENSASKVRIEELEEALRASRASESCLKSKVDELMETQEAVEQKFRNEVLVISRSCQEETEDWKTLATSCSTAPPRSSQRPHLVPVVQTLIGKLIPSSHQQYCDCARAANVNVKSMESVINPELWKEFCVRRERVHRSLQEQEYLEVSEFAPQINILTDGLDAKVRSSINEVLVLHGTTAHDAEMILKEGFDPRLAGKGLYGAGIYFTTDWCKATRYAKDADANGCYCIIVARVVLGNPYLASGPMRQHKRPPAVEGTTKVHDSIVARPGTKRNEASQVHWEFVVSEASLAYPEFIIRFRK